MNYKMLKYIVIQRFFNTKNKLKKTHNKINFQKSIDKLYFYRL